MNLFNFFSFERAIRTIPVPQTVEEKFKNIILQTGITLFSDAWYKLHQHFVMTQSDYDKLIEKEKELITTT